MLSSTKKIINPKPKTEEIGDGAHSKLSTTTSNIRVSQQRRRRVLLSLRSIFTGVYFLRTTCVRCHPFVNGGHLRCCIRIGETFDAVGERPVSPLTIQQPLSRWSVDSFPLSAPPRFLISYRIWMQQQQQRLFFCTQHTIYMQLGARSYIIRAESRAERVPHFLTRSRHVVALYTFNRSSISSSIRVSWFWEKAYTDSAATTSHLLAAV